MIQILFARKDDVDFFVREVNGASSTRTAGWPVCKHSSAIVCDEMSVLANVLTLEPADMTPTEERGWVDEYNYAVHRGKKFVPSFMWMF